MANEEAIANLVALMTSFHLEIKALPDDLKCAKCKSVLKNACQMPCGCRFCRTCIDDVISSGDQFCPGDSQECEATRLSTAQRDFRANKSVLKLTAKCPRAGCPREYPLAEMEGHMRVCSTKNIDCPFREFGCAQGALPGHEMSVHLLQESRGHSDILIGTVANISKDMEMLKRELLLKDEHVRHLENEMKLISDENKSIKLEKEVLCDQVRRLSEKLEQDSAMLTAVSTAVVLNRDEMEPIKGDIQSIKDQFNYMKCRIESIQMVVGLGQLDDWLIEADIAKTNWGGWWDNAKISGKFGLAHAFELESWNYIRGGELWISLRIWSGPSDALLEWPFRGAVTVTVAHKDNREAWSRQTRQCRIERPADNHYKSSDYFVFPHNELREGGVDLKRGVHVSCRIVPGAGQ